MCFPGGLFLFCQQAADDAQGGKGIQDMFDDKFLMAGGSHEAQGGVMQFNFRNIPGKQSGCFFPAGGHEAVNVRVVFCQLPNPGFKNGVHLTLSAVFLLHMFEGVRKGVVHGSVVVP